MRYGMLAMVVASCMVPASTTFAQGEPVVVPTELARALMGFGEPVQSKSTFVVDQAPPMWPKLLIPKAPARVLGGVTAGRSSMLVVSYAKELDGLKLLSDQIRAGGFKDPPSMEGTGMMMSLSSSSLDSTGTPIVPRIFCSDSNTVIVLERDVTRTTRTFVVGLTKESGQDFSLCHPPQGMSMQDRMPLKIPSLTPPPGVRAFQSGWGGGDTHLTMSISTDTTYDAPSLVAHYGAQLAKAGWSVAKSAGNSGGSTALELEAKDEKGTVWRGVLVAVPTARHRQVTIHMATDRSY